jgi:hypothetical protein
VWGRSVNAPLSHGHAQAATMTGTAGRLAYAQQWYLEAKPQALRGECHDIGQRWTAL